jgi:uncharacterized protein YhhL (DUF1145 family)
LAIAAFIWLEFLALYWFGQNTTIVDSASEGPYVLLRGIFIGYSQPGGHIDGMDIFRPHAFYYEPSYAGCALSFAFPLTIALAHREPNGYWRYIFAPAFILVATWMTSARSGILGTILSTAILLAGSAILRKKQLFARMGKIILTAVFLFGLLALSAQVRSYMGFFLHIIQPKGIATRMVEPSSSEGWRWANVRHSLELGAEHPLVGMGVPPHSVERGFHGLGQTSESMWLEVLVETGLLGLLAFSLGMFGTVFSAAKNGADPSVTLLVLSALAIHCLISMNLTSTFPRLDYWIIYFFGIRVLLENQKKNSREQP